jgi:hypothetical protein
MALSLQRQAATLQGFSEVDDRFLLSSLTQKAVFRSIGTSHALVESVAPAGVVALGIRSRVRL